MQKKLIIDLLPHVQDTSILKSATIRILSQSQFTQNISQMRQMGVVFRSNLPILFTSGHLICDPFSLVGSKKLKLLNFENLIIKK